MKNFLATVLTIFITVIVCVGMLEAVIRIMYSQKLDYQVEMSRYAGSLKRDSANYDIGHEHRPNKKAHLMGVDVTINSHGFRDKEYPVEKPQGVYRVMLLGDSLTFGWGAKQDRIFAVELERKLDKYFKTAGKNMKVQVINTGVGNYNTDQEVSFYEYRGRKFKPDMVILNYFINDAEPTPRQKSPLIIKYSYFAMWLWGRIDTFKRKYFSNEDYSSYYNNLYDDSRPGWQKTREAIKRLVEASKRDGFTLALVMLPELHAVGETYGFQDINDKVRAAAIEAGVENILDLAMRFKREAPESLWVSPDDAHPNEKAHAIIAQGIYDYVTSREIIK